MAERYVIRPDDVGYEPVDDEMLVIDFVSSDYYLLNGSGAAVWRSLTTAPRTVDEIAVAFAAGNHAARAGIRDDLGAFVAALAADGLVIGTVDDAAGDSVAVPALAAPYVVPRFEKFGTLERLMLAGE